MKRPIECLICVWLAFVTAQGQFAVGQDDKAPAGGLEIFTVKGSLEAISGDTVKIKSDKGEEFFAVLGQKTTFKYTGSAELSFLAPGLFVRFSGLFNPQTGALQGSIANIEVFREIRQRRMSRELLLSQIPGIYPVDENEKDKDKDKDKAKAKAKAKDSKAKDSKAKDSNAKDSNAKSNDKKGNNSAPVPADAQQFQVVGRLTAIGAGQIQVAAGNFPIMVQLEPTATVSVSAGDSTFCMPGDAVEITGLRNPDKKANWIQADTIDITGAKPLGQVENKADARTSRTQRGKLGEKDSPAKNQTTKSSSPKKPPEN